MPTLARSGRADHGIWRADVGIRPYAYNYGAYCVVFAILDSTGAVMVNYHYDAYGVLLQTGGTMATTLGTLNPLTYRGYVYDHETGLYYLQSRYYNPTVRQFISPDAFVSTGQGFMGYNMFAYCNNNPVVFKDSSGTACVIAGRGMWVGYGGVPVGAASPYIPSDAMDYNCYAYALGEKQWKHVGGCFGAVENFDVDNVAAMVLADAQKDGRTMRIIDSYDSPIESNEYRIALRTCDEDYHFMVQHNDGRWSHKPGFCSTRLIEGPNPSVISWDAPLVNDFLLQEYGIVKEVAAVVNYYDSKTVYFAVVK